MKKARLKKVKDLQQGTDGGEFFERVEVPAPWHLLVGVIQEAPTKQSQAPCVSGPTSGCPNWQSDKSCRVD